MSQRVLNAPRSSPNDSIDILTDFRRGLAETGYVEGRNLAIEYRWLEGRHDQIPKMLGDLVERRVAVIAVPNATTAALVAKGATGTIPIVFAVGTDPVVVGLVSSLNRPGGNITGVSLQLTTAAAVRLELLHQLKPAERLIAFLATRPTLFLPRPRQERCSRRRLPAKGRERQREALRHFSSLLSLSPA